MLMTPPLVPGLHGMRFVSPNPKAGLTCAHIRGPVFDAVASITKSRRRSAKTYISTITELHNNDTHTHSVCTGTHKRANIRHTTYTI